MRLLIVGSLGGHIAMAGKIALERGAKVAHVETVGAALQALRAGQGADLVMVDVMLDVGTLIDSLESERISMPVVACGIGADASQAVEAIRAGAKEYIPLPPDAELIAAVLAAVVEETTDFITRDPGMTQVMRLAEQIAPSDASVLITGESGTGKEVMARFTPLAKSKRAKRTFISVNCAAIPENLLESELFGHEKGAFTGAVTRRIGKFEEANTGTLLLDEISEMDPRLQAKLLRAIQEREIDRVGGTRSRSRSTSASSPLRTAIWRMRSAPASSARICYFRLNVVNLNLPPLRERPGDIEILARALSSTSMPRPTRSPCPHSFATPRRQLWHTTGAATSASSRTPCTGRCCLPRTKGRPEAILLTGRRLAPSEPRGDRAERCSRRRPAPAQWQATARQAAGRPGPSPKSSAI